MNANEKYELISSDLEHITSQVIDSAFKVHKTMGPGLIESVYEECLAFEFAKRKLQFKRQASLPIYYENNRLHSELRLDFLVEDRLVVELKSVEIMNPIYDAQVLTYLRLTGKRLGLLINFNVVRIKDGIRRFIL